MNVNMNVQFKSELVLALILQWNLQKRDTLGQMSLSLVGMLSLSRRSNITLFKSIIMRLKQVSFVERSSLSQRVPYWRFDCNSELLT